MSTPNLLKPPSILVIDDEPDNFDVIETLLYDENYQLHYLASGEEAIALMDSFEPDLILLDVMMPNMDGRDVCQQLKTMPKYSSVPIIIVTALQSNFDLAECFNYGADDFIRKPVNSLELRARVRSMLRIREQYKQIEHFNTMLQEVVSRKTENLQKTIFQDELTKLPSRKFLLQKLTEIVTSSKFSFALIYLNCDQFKLIHSSFGYKVSNELLISIAQRLKKLLRNHDMLAHIGQDEFCFVIKEITNVHTLEPFLQDIFRSFDKPFLVAGCEIFMSACMGIILGNNNQKTQTPEELLHNADAAMYQAKKKGKGKLSNIQ